jgi:hypothetical protein
MRTLLIALAFALAALPASAQETEQEVTTLIQQEVIDVPLGQSELTPDAAIEEIRSGLLDPGSTEADLLNGFALSDQEGNLTLLRQEGSDNQAVIDQSGAGNLAVLLQLGSNITTRATQAGSGNVFGVRLSGDNLDLGGPDGVRQIGDNNVYLLDYEGGAEQLAPTTQVGVDNRVVQIGNVSQPFGVQQFGNGQRLIIRHNGAQ